MKKKLNDTISLLTIPMKEILANKNGFVVDHTLSAMIPSINKDIRPDLQVRTVRDAIVRAISVVGMLPEKGFPTLSDRLSDMMSRFGPVLGFVLITFVFAVMDGYHDRRRRWTYTELRSKIGYSNQSAKTNQELIEDSRHVIINHNNLRKDFIHHLTQTPPLTKF